MSETALRVNRRIKDVVGSTTLAITARAKELKAQGHDVVNFAAGEPDFDTPPDIKAAGIKAIESGFTKYTPSTGTQELKEAICQKFKRDNKLEYKPSQVVVSCGAKHSLYNIVQILVDDGDEALLPAPYWVSYPEMIKMAGGVVRVVPTTAVTQFKVTPDVLKSHITSKTKIFILNSPSNPTGVVYNADELAAIAQVCVDKNIYVISDEIYEKLIYDVKEYVSIASLNEKIYQMTITVNGMSKAYAMTGWRIGYAAGSQMVMDYVKKLQDHSTSNPASISQAAALAALKAPEESIEAMRAEFQRRRDLMMAELDKIPSISYIRPQGAFYLFCDFSKIGSAEAVAKQILDDVKVALIPGEGFGAPGFIRMSFATSAERIQEGAKRIAQWVKTKSLTK